MQQEFYACFHRCCIPGSDLDPINARYFWYAVYQGRTSYRWRLRNKLICFQSEWTKKYLAAYHAEARNHASADSVQWQRKGVPLHIVQSQGPMERTLTDIVALAKVLYQEEQKAFHAAMAESADRCGKTNGQAYVSGHSSCKGGFQGTACCMHMLRCMLQSIFSISIAVVSAS